MVGAVAGVVVASVIGACAGHGHGIPLPVLPEASGPRELPADQQIKQALARLTFGPRPHETDRLGGQLDHWLRLQLAPEALDDPTGDSIDAAHALLHMAAAELTAESPPLGGRSVLPLSYSALVGLAIGAPEFQRR
jgi:hypothetical protein